MAATNQGSMRLGRVAGIDVFLHWSWLLVAAYEINQRTGRYTSLTWNVLEYLILFFLVLLHEFGHCLACRQVGGRADRIVLWPLGGVAYVDPPRRPGATLWAIAAGPLVNVVLVPVLLLLGLAGAFFGVFETAPNVLRLLDSLWVINLVLLTFNLLPIYPLDGGKIVWSLLWFVLGPAWGLMIATVIGFAGVVGLGLLAWRIQSYWLGIMAVFVLFSCWNGLQQALRLIREGRWSRRPGLACPVCGAAPPAGAFWTCGQCRKRFDIFESRDACPHCGRGYLITHCLDCGKDSALASWAPTPEPPASIPPLPALPE